MVPASRVDASKRVGRRSVVDSAALRKNFPERKNCNRFSSVTQENIYISQAVEGKKCNI